MTSMEALAQLRLKLLDLTGRNRLINYKATIGKSLQFVEGNPVSVYDKLVESSGKISLIGLPVPAQGDWVERNGRLQMPDPLEWARLKGISTSQDLSPSSSRRFDSNVRALKYPEELAKHCRKIEREATLAIEETGANMLFLALGFLEFPEQTDSDKLFFAPLVCVPVRLVKTNSLGTPQFALEFTGDDIAENLSLREKLKRDFGISIPELIEEQFGLSQYFDEIKNAVRGQPRFSLKSRISLCMLSFSNMLLVRDLDPSKWPSIGNGNALLDHPIVRQIFEGAVDDGGATLGSSPEHDVENQFGRTIPLVFDADSSQHSALMDVIKEKKNLVVEGPPGTGKSQTITNLIAASLAEGKKVLFVAEKLAALEVVKSRLTLAGLDPFVLELHSNKANKKDILEALHARTLYKPNRKNGIENLEKQAEANHADLKAYSALVNTVAHNSLGRTLHAVMWAAERFRLASADAAPVASRMRVDDAASLPEFEFRQRLELLRQIARQFDVIGGVSTHSSFWGFVPQHLSGGDEASLEQDFLQAKDWSLALGQAVDRLTRHLGGPCQGETAQSFSDKLHLLNQVQIGAPDDLPSGLVSQLFCTDATGQAAETLLDSLEAQIAEFKTLEQTCLIGLKDESGAKSTVVSQLKALRDSAQVCGVGLGSIDGFSNLQFQLEKAIGELGSAYSSFSKLLKGLGYRHDGSQLDLEKILALASLMLRAPIESLHLLNPALTEFSAVRSLEVLHGLEERWSALEAELSSSLHIDVAPPLSTVEQAVLTLRTGKTWYRVFQSSWRKAIQTHSVMQRSRVDTPVEMRLAQLEKWLVLQAQKKEWRDSSFWSQLIGSDQQPKPGMLAGFLAVAAWARSVRVASDDLGIRLFDPKGLTPALVRELGKEFVALKKDAETTLTSLEQITHVLKGLARSPDRVMIRYVLKAASDFNDVLSDVIPWLNAKALPDAALDQVVNATEAVLKKAMLKVKLRSNEAIKHLLGEAFMDVDTDCGLARRALQFGQEINALALPNLMKQSLLSGDPVKASGVLHRLIGDAHRGLEKIAKFTEGMNRYGRFDIQAFCGISPDGDLGQFVWALQSAIGRAHKDVGLLVPWAHYFDLVGTARDLGLTDFVNALERKEIASSLLPDAYAYCVYNSIMREAFRKHPQLNRFNGLVHSQVQETFRQLDREIIKLRGAVVGRECAQRASPPGGQNGVLVSERTEMTLLNHLMTLQRPRMPVRKMLSRAGAAIQELKPCFMMGPQAVAQFLAPGGIKFDLVIMDEASQLKPEEALGSVARGTQLVVVGDPKQLPPTSFFSRMNTDAEDEGAFTTSDAESILDVCASHFRPIRSLRWHYRSQHHSLIAFSNHKFYKNLVIFPSPYERSHDLGVRAVYLADAVYENQVNLREAERIVGAVIEHVGRRPKESLGVVTLNIKQRDLIAELLEDRVSNLTEYRDFQEFWAPQGQALFIKNLENVQGDERDAIIVSTTFGRPPGSGAVRQNFGPISRQGGWRRLNVLFTRAKRSITVYTSLRPEDIVVDGTTPDGTKVLREYLEYARSGSLPTIEGPQGEPESDFEIAVMQMLESHGYAVTPQLGVAGFRIDLAVNHPDIRGCFLAAIECDGATYHSAQSVRDRDRIRQEILESMGWRNRIWRIWSTDWFRSPQRESEKLISFLGELRQTWKPEHSSGAGWTEEGQVSSLPSLTATQGGPSVADDEPQNTTTVVSAALIDSAEDIEVQVGDTVKYLDLSDPAQAMSAQIVQGKDDIHNGVVNEGRPLAQALLGALVGDEVVLRLAGGASRTFRIVEIKRIQSQLSF